jgi:hypothetical protein
MTMKCIAFLMLGFLLGNIIANRIHRNTIDLPIPDVETTALALKWMDAEESQPFATREEEAVTWLHCWRQAFK